MPAQYIAALGQLAGAGHAFPVDDKWRQHLFIPVLRGVQVQHEIDQRALQAGTRTQV